MAEAIDLQAEFAATGLGEEFGQLDRELVGLAPVKQRIRQIAALLLVDRARARLRHATRLFEGSAVPVTAEQLSTIEPADIAASRVFAEAERPG